MSRRALWACSSSLSHSPLSEKEDISNIQDAHQDVSALFVTHCKNAQRHCLPYPPPLIPLPLIFPHLPPIPIDRFRVVFRSISGPALISTQHSVSLTRNDRRMTRNRLQLGRGSEPAEVQFRLRKLPAQEVPQPRKASPP